MSFYVTRPCCNTNYDREHLNDCPVRGFMARSALPCDITSDGWCAAHSTSTGPTYCLTTTRPTAALAETAREIEESL